MKIAAMVSLILLLPFVGSAQQTATFNYQINGPVPPAQAFSITSTYPGFQIPELSVSSTAADMWLQAFLSSASTPATLTIALNPPALASLTAGTYTGNVQVSSPFMSNTVGVLVILVVTPAPPTLSLSSSSFIFNAFEDGPSPASQTLVVGASNSGVAVSSAYGPFLPKWLILYNPLPNDPTSPWAGTGTAPVTITVAVDQTGLAAGTYSYPILFSSAQGSNVTVNVTLLVAAPAVTVSTSQLQFQCSAGLVSPPPQTVQVQSTSSTPLNASVTFSVPWLAANVQSGTTPFSLNIQPDCAALSVGTFTGKVVIADTSYSDSQTINVVLTVGQPISAVANVTNAALPGLDNPPSTVTLAPRSMATIFGSNLADSIVVSPSPWSSPLGGTEVHLASDTCFDASCDIIANLIYVSPAQINFLVPDTTAAGPVSYRIVLLRDGQRIDDQSSMLGGPGRLIVDPSGAADSSVVFEVGYDCLFSSSLIDPGSCGLSWSSGQDRAPVGAVTDAISGQLISSQNPVYQGRLITLWMTALRGGVALDSQTGLQTGKTIIPVGFGVEQLGKDIEGTLGVQPPTAPDTPSIPIGTFMSPTPLWAGESPQFVGLDQVNVAFPTCTNAPAAISEKRYDAFLTYTSLQTGTTSRIYLPFDVRVGDPDCQWVATKTPTTLALTSSLNPSIVGQATVLTATASPSTATGVVTFFDGNTMLGSQALSAGVASLSVSTFSLGTHSITVVYNGDSNCTGSTAVLTQTVSLSASTVTVASDLNPAVFAQTVVFTATVSPATATGTVTFSDGSTALGSGTLSAGTATLSVSTLTVGSHSITAAYGGDGTDKGGTSAVLTQTINQRSSTTALGSSDASSTWGGAVQFTATVIPSNATGTVTFFDGPVASGAGLGTVSLSGGQATFTTSSLSAGIVNCFPGANPCTSWPVPITYSFRATYNGDADTAGSTSPTIEQQVNPLQPTLTAVSDQNSSSNTNPTPGPLFTATASPAYATGSVVFYAGSGPGTFIIPCNGTASGEIPLSNGLAICNASPGLFPGPGVYTISAMLTGSGSCLGAGSLDFTQTVTQ